jgi:hypothetical protein
MDDEAVHRSVEMTHLGESVRHAAVARSKCRSHSASLRAGSSTSLRYAQDEKSLVIHDG